MTPLVAPEIPDAQRNQGPALFLQALGQGLQAVARFAEMKRQSESDMLQIAARERMAQQEHELGKQKLELDTEYRNHEMRIEDELLPYKKMEMEAAADWKKVTHGARAKAAADKMTTLNDFNRRFMELGLDDPNPTNPVQFYANANKLRDEYAFANIPVIKHTLKEVERTTERHTVPISINDLVVDEVTGEKVIKPTTKNMPVGKIVEALRDPAKQDSMMGALERSGFFEEAKESANPDAAGVQHQGTRTVLKAEIRRILEQGKNVDFARSKARVLPDGSMAGTSDQSLFEPSETETKLQQARAAISGGAPREAVVARLQELGIDAGDL